MPQPLKTLPRWFTSPRPDGDPIPIEWWEDARSSHELLALVGVLAGLLETRCSHGPVRIQALDEARQWLEASGLHLMPIAGPDLSRSALPPMTREAFGLGPMPEASHG